MNIDQLKKIIPDAGPRAGVFLNSLNSAMAEFGIDTPIRQAAFIAQIAHESGSLRYVREIASGKAYEGRADLGNTQPGDGVKFKGRGLLQITGRANYAACSSDLYDGPDFLIQHPEVLETVSGACRSAAWFWKKHNLNKWADAKDIDGVSDMVNRGRKTQPYGDANGFKERFAFYAIALPTLTA